MKFSKACLHICLAAPLAGAFVPIHQHRQQQQHLRQLDVSGTGWDNESFLSSLGGDAADRKNANDKYFKMSRYDLDPDYEEEKKPLLSSESIDGASFSPDMVEKAKASHSEEEESSQGGSMFREMMKRAQSQAQARPPTPPQPQYAAPTPPAAAAPMDMNNLSVEEQARLFREMMQQQQQGAVPQPQAQAPPQHDPYAAPPPGVMPQPKQNFLPGGVDDVGRKIGRNRDADAIQNTADLYFAQLKMDSKARNYARYSGNDEAANQVFADPKIHQIEIPINPYLQEQLEQEKNLFETTIDEMLLPEMFTIPENKQPVHFSGVSYRDRLKQRQKGGGSGAAAEPPAPVVEEPVAEPEPVAEVVEEPVATPEPVVAPEAVEQDGTWAEKLSMDQPQEEEIEMPAGPRSAAEAEASPIAPPPSSAEEAAKRKEIRTLMGLILKHRGGPGFGAGRLKGAEAEKMETMASEMSDFLKKEAMQFPQGSSHAQDLTIEQPPSIEEESVVIEEPVAMAAPPAPEAPATPAPSAVSAQPAVERIQSLIACIEGAILMYTNSPAELKESVLITLRAALLSAANTCNEVIGDGSEAPAGGTIQAQSLGGSYDPAKPQGERVDSLISCIQGAIQMYRNSPPELQGSVLVTLRAALMSGINTCNGIIAENEMKNLEAYQQSTASAQEVVLDMTGDDVSVEDAPAEIKVESVSTATKATDINSKFFEEVLGKLKESAGDGKMGLREDLSPSEAEDLSDSILKMRSVLIEELDTGIPTSSKTSSDKKKAKASAAASSSSSAGSKYQEMLAKARAAKEHKP